MIGPHFSDEGSFGGTGEYDRPLTTIVWGAVAPLACVVAAVWVIVDGGITIPSERGLTAVTYRGMNAVCSCVTFLLGVAAILIAALFMPNVFRQSYAYQYVGFVGTVMACGGLLWFVAAALV